MTDRRRPAGRPRIAILEHHPRDPLGALSRPLERAADLVVVRGFDNGSEATAQVEHLVAKGDYDGVIALGGPMAVYEREAVPHLLDSLRLLDDALNRGVPILGLCLGSQMLSEVAGSPVFSGRDRGMPAEVGFFPLRMTEAGRHDPVMQAFSGPEPVLFWHQDTHDLPRGGVHLAATDLYSMAAFRLGPHVYGFQYHLETTPELLAVWVKQSPLLAVAGVDGGVLLEQARGLGPVIHSRAERLAELFLGWVREDTGG
jgi:GMP synthase (glutamine-hydrolysing)